jgi:hypothetical protein
MYWNVRTYWIGGGARVSRVAASLPLRTYQYVLVRYRIHLAVYVLEWGPSLRTYQYVLVRYRIHLAVYVLECTYVLD